MLNRDSEQSSTLHGVIAFCLASILLSSCSAAKLDPLEKVQVILPPPKIEVEVDFCTDPSQVVKSKLKYIIVLDHSGSNITNYKIDPTTGEPWSSGGLLDVRQEYGTDPDKTARYGDTQTTGSLLNFIHNIPDNDPHDPSVYFSLFNFSGGFEQWPSNNTFSSDVRAFEAEVIDKKLNKADSGATNYIAVLNQVNALINSDIKEAKICGSKKATDAPTATCPNPGRHISSNYVIVFMSDGAPILEVKLSGPSPTTVRQLSADVLSTVAGIMGLQANSRYVDSVNLFTVYYYQPANRDPFAEKLLKDMAELGNAVSYNLTSGSNIDYRRFRSPNRLIKFSLADIFVTNSSVVMGANGEALLDSDTDGIEDSKELELGSSIDEQDSDFNGVSDLVEFTVKGGKLNGVGTVDYANGPCTTVVKTTSPSGAIQFKSSDPSGLNDCEKVVLNNLGGIGNPDSNGDLLPDWLQLKNGLPFQIGALSAKETQDVDGMSYYQKIKTSLPARTPYYLLQNPSPAKYDLEIVSTNVNEDCYKLKVENLPVIGKNNLIQVDVVMTSSLLQDRFLYRQANKRFQDDSYFLSFQDWNDAVEIAKSTWRSWP